MHPDEIEVNFYNIEEVLQGLINWKEILLSKECNKSQMMKLQLVRYFINLYKSKMQFGIKSIVLLIFLWYQEFLT